MKPIPIILVSALAVTAFASMGEAAATDSPALPEFDMMRHCRDLTSKMLVKSEQALETAKCVYVESIAKGQLENHWGLVTPAAVKDCMKYQKPAWQSYFIFRGCVSYSIGLECMKDAYRCSLK